MFLFLVASLPLLFCMVVLLPWGVRGVPQPLTLVSTFLKGVLVFFPGYLVILIVRRIFGFSYDGVLLYLSFLQRDHLVPLVAAAGAFLILHRYLAISATDEGIFLTTFACVAGFLSLMNIADALRTWGTGDAYDLFLLPTLRITGTLFIALAAKRYYRWEGRDGWMFCGAAAACAVVLTICSCLFSIGRVGWSVVLCVLLAAGSAAALSMRFPSAVRG